MVQTRRAAKREKESTTQNQSENEDSSDIANDGGEGIDLAEESDRERTSRKSPYSDLRRNLTEIADEDDALRRRTKLPRKSKSRSRSRSPGRKTVPIQSRTSPKVLVTESKLSKKVVQEKRSSCKTFTWVVIYLVMVFVLCSILYSIARNILFNRFSPNYQDVLKEYKSELPSISISIIESAIEKYHKNQNNLAQKNGPPVPLLLYGSNQTKIREFYFKLATTLVRSTEEATIDQLILSIDQIKNKNDLVHNLSKYGVILFDGLEKLDGKNYMQLYGFVDDSDSHVHNCLIVMSLHSKQNESEINFDGIDKSEQIELIENRVKKQLRNRWSSAIDTNNLEAFLNRIVSFVAYVL